MQRTRGTANMETISGWVGRGSACSPVIAPVFKTGGWQVFLSLVGSTPTRFRHLLLSRRTEHGIRSASCQSLNALRGPTSVWADADRAAPLLCHVNQALSEI